MILRYQKYIIFTLLFIINLLLSTTLIIYSNKWYIFLFILALASLINSFSSLLVIGSKMCLENNDKKYRFSSKNYIYIIPCYNESEEELTNSINSLVNQQTISNDKRCLMIICDGKVKGNNNTSMTHIILKKILSINILPFYYDYMTWDGNKNLIELYYGEYSYNNIVIPYILIVKCINYGKRDSLVLARRLCYNYNNMIESTSNDIEEVFIDDNYTTDSCSLNLNHTVNDIFNNVYNEKIEYIIGIDADTIFDYNCSYELIKDIDMDKNIHGCVGIVNIVPKMNLFTLYQYAEYMFAQCLRRHSQSYITHKVNCLSGCNQVLRISKETCGEEILQKFNYLPKDNENIFNHIRSYASEDRNHVCLMLSMYPYVKTTQTLKAICYTNIPLSIKVFLSQRRRWSLGANSNDMMLVYLKGINIFERISAFVNVMTFSLTPFIFIATILFLKNIITEPSILMLYLSIIMIIPLTYAIMIPIFINQLSFREAMYYYLSLIVLFSFGSIVHLCVYFNSLLNMDVIKWGKTRSIDTPIKEYTSSIIKICKEVSEMSTDNILEQYTLKTNIDKDDIYIKDCVITEI
jgi:chitin synthase